MGHASIDDKSVNRESVVPVLKVATRADHLAGGTLHLFPNLWEPGDFPDPEPDPEHEAQPDA